MNLKLRVLGLGLVALVATGAFAVVNASAFTPVNSHFTADPPTHVLKITGTDAFGTNHGLSFTEAGNTGISCTHVTYHGELTGAAATTTQSVRVRPAYKNCGTEGGAWGTITVDVPAACGTNVFEFTSGTPGTVHLNCDITITHPNCEITVPKQGKLSGVTYTTDTAGGRHSLTLDVDVGKITGHFHGGICVFLGTTHVFHMKGASTVFGEDKDANRVNITHT